MTGYQLATGVSILILALANILLGKSVKDLARGLNKTRLEALQDQSELIEKIYDLQARLDKHEEVRENLYRKLADPETIQEELEKSADLREMRDAERATLPREDAGPPAVIHRPVVRGVRSGSWREEPPPSPRR